MKALHPIEIVGGGLAGLSLGLGLRRAGVPVTLFEAGDYPRHRVCGEFIAGLDAATIQRLHLAPFLADALPHREVAWFIAQKNLRRQRLPAPALGLSRHTLDARLADAFVAAGGVLRRHTRVIDSTTPDGRVFATGRRPARSPWIGLKIHALHLPLAADLELHLGAQSYLGLARIDAHRVNLCGLFRRRELSGKGAALLLAYLHAAGLTQLAVRLTHAEFDAASFCAVSAVGFDRQLPVSNRFELGDTCAMIPPFTGNGMAMAFQSAALALDPLLAYARHELTWAAAQRTVRTALRRHFRLRLASAATLHPFLLRPSHQRWLTLFSRAGLLPLRPLYAALH